MSSAGTSTTAFTSGRIAGIVVGSTVALLFIVILALVGKRKLTANPGTDLHGEPNFVAKLPELDGDGHAKREIHGCMILGVELDASRDVQEMKSNEEVGQELHVSNLQVSELPS